MNKASQLVNLYPLHPQLAQLAHQCPIWCQRCIIPSGCSPPYAQKLGALTLAKSPLMQAAFAAGAGWISGKVAEVTGSRTAPPESSSGAQPQPQPQVRSASSASSVKPPPAPAAVASLSSAQLVAGASVLGSALMSWGGRAIAKAASSSSTPSSAAAPAAGSNASFSGSSFTNLATTLLANSLKPQQAPAENLRVHSMPASAGYSSAPIPRSSSSGLGGAVMTAALAALSAAPGQSTDAAISSLRQTSGLQQQRQEGYYLNVQQNYSQPAVHVNGGGMAMGIPVDSMSHNPIRSHPPPPSAPPLPPSAPPPPPVDGGRDNSSSEADKDLVPEQQHPLFNAGKLYFIERRGGSQILLS